jgi:hypothetical protein
MADEESAQVRGDELVPGGHLRATHDDRKPRGRDAAGPQASASIVPAATHLDKPCDEAAHRYTAEREDPSLHGVRLGHLRERLSAERVDEQVEA